MASDSEFNETLDKLRTLWQDQKKQIALQGKEAEDEMSKLMTENAELNAKYNEAQSKIDKIESQLKDTIDQMESITKSKAKGIDAMQLLDVYLVLMENVFESAAHTRLLLILHGEKESYTLDELTMAAGISGIQVRQAMFELRNAGVIDYNDDTQVVTLKTRFLS